MRPIPSVVHMSVKRSNQVMFVLTQPDVHKPPNTDTYEIFGDAKTKRSENMAAAAAQIAQAEQAAAQASAQ